MLWYSYPLTADLPPPACTHPLANTTWFMNSLQPVISPVFSVSPFTPLWPWWIVLSSWYDLPQRWDRYYLVTNEPTRCRKVLEQQQLIIISRPGNNYPRLVSGSNCHKHSWPTSPASASSQSAVHAKRWMCFSFLTVLYSFVMKWRPLVGWVAWFPCHSTDL